MYTTISPHGQICTCMPQTSHAYTKSLNRIWLGNGIAGPMRRRRRRMRRLRAFWGAAADALGKEEVRKRDNVTSAIQYKCRKNGIMFHVTFCLQGTRFPDFLLDTIRKRTPYSCRPHHSHRPNCQHASQTPTNGKGWDLSKDMGLHASGNLTDVQSDISRRS